jgi:hypothetical protein
MSTIAEGREGQADATPGLQRELDRCGEIHIPAGTYLLGETLRVHSETSIVADPGAAFRLAGDVGKHCRNFMITNANPGNGNSNISLQGGIWDANNAGNPRGTDYEPFAYTGVAINFTNVRGLTLRSFTVHNPESFFVRVGEVCSTLMTMWSASSTWACVAGLYQHLDMVLKGQTKDVTSVNGFVLAKGDINELRLIKRR